MLACPIFLDYIKVNCKYLIEYNFLTRYRYLIYSYFCPFLDLPGSSSSKIGVDNLSMQDFILKNAKVYVDQLHFLYMIT
jgi:hypothetical protein